MSGNIGKLSANASRDISIAPGRYLLSFSQGGAWSRNGLAYLDLTGYVNGSYFSWICGNISSMMDVVINASGITITINEGMGVDINCSCTKIKAY